MTYDFKVTLTIFFSSPKPNNTRKKMGVQEPKGMLDQFSSKLAN